MENVGSPSAGYTPQNLQRFQAHPRVDRSRRLRHSDGGRIVRGSGRGKELPAMQSRPYRFNGNSRVINNLSDDRSMGIPV
jgi:hypothetical protein